MTTAREAAFLALLSPFISEWLLSWKKRENPDDRDYRLAQEIAIGSCRMALSLDELGKQLTPQHRLSLKLKEKALLRTALYQALMMDRIPLHAIVNETVKIAKSHNMRQKASFFNALLRKLSTITPKLPSGDSLEAFSVRYSYPLLFIEKMLAAYSLEKAVQILECLNLPSQVMARVRSPVDLEGWKKNSLAVPFVFVDTPEKIQFAANSQALYIQNATPSLLMHALKDKLSHPPKTILDLCASPGGKLLQAHDLFPQAKLFANDVSADKLRLLQENLEKYGIKAALSEGPGETYSSSVAFDLILLDVPCSNSGVLHKRPEARWRLTSAHLKELKNLQEKLISHATSLLAPGGALWYMTCSILPEENERLTDEASKTHSLRKLFEMTKLPTQEASLDGGYAAVLLKK